MEDTIKINSENLADYAMFKLNKEDNSFTKEELSLIEEVLINFNDEVDNKFLEDLENLSNLKSITFRNGYINNIILRVLMSLKNLTNLTFDNCAFEEEKLIASFKLKELSLISCQINDYSFVYIMSDLEALSIVNGEVEINKLNLLNKLSYLEITNSNILDNEQINISSIHELYIDNTSIDDLSFLDSLNDLKKVSIDDHQYEDNKVLVKKLINKGVSFYDEAISPIVGDDYGE